MIVYGDPQFKIGAADLLKAVCERLFSTREEDIDELRSLLIHAGQLEQAIEDSPAHQVSAALTRKITGLAAVAFHAAWSACQPELDPLRNTSSALEELRQILRDANGFSSEHVTVKIPEGFEFYALYPEQYCLSALSWSRHNPCSNRDRTVLVVGIRSIGTTLSALVAATLEAIGWRTNRITVRPSGPPFARTLELPSSVRNNAQFALVVDEGPGLSGSSMAAVARALVESGFARPQISFLPGHAGEPGPAASAEVRSWWTNIPRYVTALEDVRWNGLSLTEALRKKSCELVGENSPNEVPCLGFTSQPGFKLPPKPFSLSPSQGERARGERSIYFLEAPEAGQSVHLEDFSAGLWRNAIFSTPSMWPWAAIPFERMKYRCSISDDVSILWKFVGLGSLRQEATGTVWQSADSSNQSWSPQPLGWFRGFIALPWINGKRLSCKDGRDPDILNHISHYVAAVSKPPLPPGEQAASLARLEQMLFWNTKEALGDTLAERALRTARKLRNLGSCPAYGDGRLAPYEWVRTQAGYVIKPGAGGHDTDHTIIGRQPVYWDVAAAMVEWKLSACSRLLAAMRVTGIALRSEALPFFRLAYAAFRMGQASLCADACADDPPERARSQHAFSAYRADLRRQLERLA